MKWNVRLVYILGMPIIVLTVVMLLLLVQATPTQAQSVAEGKAAFNANCALCHGPAGDVGPPLGKDTGYFVAYGLPSQLLGGLLMDTARGGIDGKMPSFSQERLSDGEIMAIGEYLVSIAPEVSVGAFPGDATRGATVYTTNCQGCHGVNGVGVEGIGPPIAFTAAAFNQMGLPPQTFYAITTMAVREGAPPAMPVYNSAQISDADLASIAAFIQSVAPAELPAPPAPPVTGGYALSIPSLLLIAVAGSLAVFGGTVLLRRGREKRA